MIATEGEAYDPGQILWQAPRGESERLRLSRREYQGRPFLDLRIEYRDHGGAWRPTKKGVSLRVHELADVQAALGRAVAALVTDAGGVSR